MKKRIIALICCFLMVMPMFAQAKVGVDVVDPGKVDLWYNFEPVKETQTITRYTPWYYVMHLPSKKHLETGVNGGEGGQLIYDMSISPVNPDHMLASIDVGSIYISTDGGKNFSFADRNLPMNGLADSVWDPDDENTVYGFMGNFGSSTITTPETKAASGYQGIYKSTNNGKVWTQVLECVTLQNRRKIGMQFDNNGVLYVNAYEGLFRSPDKGKTWEKFGQLNVNSSGFYVHPEDGWMARAIVGDGIYYSSDGGNNWELLTEKIEGSESAHYNFDVSPNDCNTWVCIVDDILYYTYDRGKTWEGETQEAYTLRRTNTMGGKVNTSSTPYKVQFGCYNPDGDPALYICYSGSVQPFKWSHDIGKTWGTTQPTDALDLVINESYNGNTGYQIEAIATHPSEPYTVFFSFNDVLYKSTDGGVNFYYSGSGMSGNRGAKFIFDDPNYAVVMPCTDKGILRTLGEIDGVYYWENSVDSVSPRYSNSKSIGDYSTDPFDPSHVICTIGNWSAKILAESWDYGAHFKHVEGILTSLSHFHKTRQGMIYTKDNISTDGGKTWTALEKSISAVSESDNDVLYHVNSTTRKVFRSEDCGTTWTELTGTLPSAVQLSMVDPTNSYIFYVLLSNGSIVVYENDELVKTITTANGIEYYDEKYAPTLAAFAVDPDDPNHWLLGGRNSRTDGKGAGTYESWDGGETWEVVPGLPGSRDIWAFGFEPGTDKVWISTSGGTVIYEFEKYKQWKEEVLANGYEFYINGVREKDINVLPQFDEGEVYVGIRSLFENMHYEVKWDAENNAATIKIGKKTYTLDMDDNKIYVNGKVVEGDYNLHYYNDNSMISFTALRDVFGFKTGWNLTTGEIGVSE